MIHQAITQPIIEIYEEIFSEYSYGFRPGRSCHDAVKQALDYLNDGYEWVIDIDIEQFFDKVNHDKLIQILREQVNDSTTLNLIRKYLKAGVIEHGLEQATRTGVPQGGPLSVVLSNVYLDKLDKERSKYLGFTFLKNGSEWKVKPTKEKKKKLKEKLSEYLKRGKAIARSLAVTIKCVNEITRGWITTIELE